FSISGIDNLNDVKVQIFSASGQQVMNIVYANQFINISNLPRGVYVVRIFNEAKLIGTQKLIVGR
ncbi:MAG: T9SS type A sorting domain-containing protein, partial [Perlabentimonas sp.]